jgi:hypothetical protein
LLPGTTESEKYHTTIIMVAIPFLLDERALRFIACAGPRLFLPLVFVEPLGNFFLVPGMVELQQPVEHLAPGQLAQREANALLGFVEVVAEVEVRPAVGIGHGAVHFHVEIAEFLDVGGGFGGGVEQVVGLGKPGSPSRHYALAMSDVGVTDLLEHRLRRR